jgi:REP element-mobilizing transposase RayT
MKKPDKYLLPLQTNNYYHIYNRAVGRDNLFFNEGNYEYFLKKYTKYISPIADTFAYCLLPNHFHVAIRIKSSQDINLQSGFRNLTGVDKSKLLSKQFSNFFNSYTKSLNKQQKRSGTLFDRAFKRLLISDKEYFQNIIHYIHFNAVHHGFVRDLRDWRHSSFESFFSPSPSKIKREEAIDWFGNKDAFYQFHQKEIDTKMALDLEF